ncbi:hypothetical protein EGH25_06735 [Haladaptatus sp. F3-133]|uniref:Uncharacterized protein n=1 Tax=Halorutilus salinus TaxID=2487751 RepID=A0A9Q4C384_9EURY|nr:hypothetical protein [Halorutilus salinus]MCX2819045.1 hypothetical protein [Halorutilus salinus]
MSVTEDTYKQLLESRRNVREVKKYTKPANDGASKEDLQEYCSAVRDLVSDIEMFVRQDGRDTMLGIWKYAEIGEFETLPKAKRYYGGSSDKIIDVKPAKVKVEGLENFLDYADYVVVEITVRTPMGNGDTENITIPIPWEISHYAYREANFFLAELNSLPDIDEDLPEGMEL